MLRAEVSAVFVHNVEQLRRVLGWDSVYRNTVVLVLSNAWSCDNELDSGSRVHSLVSHCALSSVEFIVEKKTARNSETARSL